MSTGNFEPGIGAIVGSAIFNILVIPAVSVFADGKPSANRDIVYKEAQFYMLSIAVLLLTSSMAVIYKPIPGEAFTGELTRVLGIIPVHVYGLYVFIQYMDTRDSERKRVQEVSELKEWALLATSLVFIVVGVEVLVRSAVEPGEIFNTPSLLYRPYSGCRRNQSTRYSGFLQGGEEG